MVPCYFPQKCVPSKGMTSKQGERIPEKVVPGRRADTWILLAMGKTGYQISPGAVSMAAPFTKLHLAKICVPITSHGLYHVRTDTQVKAKQHKTKIKQFLLWINLLSIGEDNYCTALKIIC